MDTKKLRQKILDLAIRGKLVPQDPNDEPASVLLERIRAEKERLIKEGKIKRSKKSAAEEEIEAPFEIPESWEWTTVGNVCETCLGKMLDKQKNQGVLHPYLRNINVRWGNFDLSDLLQMPFEDSETERYSICYDDLVVCEGGEPGRCAIWKDNKPIRFQKALHRVRCYKGISNYFLQTVLRLFFENGMLEMYYTGSTIKHLTGDSLNSIVIPLPPEKEQIRIVSLVEKWFAVIDELESNEGDLLKAIDQAKSKILDLAIHGKLVPQDPNDEPAINLLKRINPKFEACYKDFETNQLPENWIWTTLASVCEIITGSTPSKTHPEYYGGDFPFYKPSDLDAGRHVITPSEYLSDAGKKVSRIIPKNSTAICCIGSIGKSGYIEREGTTNQQINTAVPSASLYPLYLYYYCNSTFFIDNLSSDSSAVTIAIVNKTKMAKMLISLPPIAEQKRIVTKIEELFAVLDSIKLYLS